MPNRTIGIHMRTRTMFCLLACCCAALAACTAAPLKGPSTTVSAPSVGRPPAPASVQAAVSSEALTPYTELGLSDDDGLAPGESQFVLAGPCMDAAGYPGITVSDGIVGLAVSLGHGIASMALISPWGGWGYLGTVGAQEYGFLGPSSGLPLGMAPPASPPSVPKAEQAAASKCSSVLEDFSNATRQGPLAGINTLADDITDDVQKDVAVRAATRAWSACMAKNGYSFDQPQTVWNQQMQAMYPDQHRFFTEGPVSKSVNQAQIAVAVTDAGCSLSSDLAGIYFAVQASYEQQVVAANQHALAAAVSQYRAAYAKELKHLPALLSKAKA